jgi:aspartate aminotransferase
MCDVILKETGVALLPGSDFGFGEKKMLVRLSYTDFDGKNFMNEFKKKSKIDEHLILECAPKVVEGVLKLKKWSETI